MLKAQTLLTELGTLGHWLSAPGQGGRLLRVTRHNVLDLARVLKSHGFLLQTAIGNDERELEDRCFKVYYLFKHPSSVIQVHAEYLLQPAETRFVSLKRYYPAVLPFEVQISELLGISPDQATAPDSILHDRYPKDFYPLQRSYRMVASQERDPTKSGKSQESADSEPHSDSCGGSQQNSRNEQGGAIRLSWPGRISFPVGPVHAGVIEPGRFNFHVDGEIIEDLEIGLGYTHRGIEETFQSRVKLLDGWRLAEQVSGDSLIAHSVAYCRAVEQLTTVEPTAAAVVWRNILLELERLRNHITDIGAIARDVGLVRASNDVLRIREILLELSFAVSGHRYMGGAVRPGGVAFEVSCSLGQIRSTVEMCVDTFSRLADRIVAKPGFRSRCIGVGVLTAHEVALVGATGLVAKASCGGAQADEAGAGDVYARCLVRISEVRSSMRAIVGDLKLLEQLGSSSPLWRKPEVRPENNYTFAVGTANGFRGDVLYWVMQDKLGGIFRCKVTDPSMVNWPALRIALTPRSVAEADGSTTHVGGWFETALSDFPLVNRSFNLSYAGNDL